MFGTAGRPAGIDAKADPWISRGIMKMNSNRKDRVFFKE
jgi:hypothetical protein